MTRTLPTSPSSNVIPFPVKRTRQRTVNDLRLEELIRLLDFLHRPVGGGDAA